MRHVMVAAATGWILAGLVVGVALGLTAALARAHGRRLERRIAAELGRRWDVPTALERVPVTESPASEADLHITLEELLEQRDTLLEEFQDVQEQIQVLKKEVERRRRIVSVPDEDETTADVILLRDLAPGVDRSMRRR